MSDIGIGDVLRNSLSENGVAGEAAEKIVSSLELNNDGELTFEDENSAFFAARNLSAILRKFGPEGSVEKIGPEEQIEPSEKETDAVYDGRLKKLSKAPRWAALSLSVLLWILLAAAKILVYALAVVLCVLSVIVIIAATVAGIVLFLTGFLYGISQIGVFNAAALYEIGFALILGGICALIALLTFNFLLHTIPYLTRKTNKLISKGHADIIGFMKSLRKVVKKREVAKK